MGKVMDSGAPKATLAQSLAEALLRVCEGKNVPIAAMQRLTTPSGHSTLEAMAKLIAADWQSEPAASVRSVVAVRSVPRLREERVSVSSVFVAAVVYIIPSMNLLKERFPRYVDEAFNSSIAFKSIGFTEEPSRENRPISFGIVRFQDPVSAAEARAVICKRGARPALPEELLSFAVRHPVEAFRSPTVALGAQVEIKGKQYVMSVSDSKEKEGRRLDLRCIESTFHDNYQFLTVTD